LFEQDGERDWKDAQTLGLSLDVKLFREEGKSLFGGLKLSAGNTVSGDKDWKYTYYDAGIYCAAGRKYLHVSLGCGFRFYDAHKNIKNRNAAYFSLGLRLGK
jgi:hypothetical protein